MAIQVGWAEIRILTRRIVFRNVLRVAHDPLSKKDALDAAIKPFFAVQFTKAVVTGVDNYKLMVLMARLKRPDLPREWYAQLFAHAMVAWAGDSIATPFLFEEWIVFLVRSELNNFKDFHDRMPLLNHLVAYGVNSPTELAEWPRFDVASLAAAAPDDPLILKLWQSACLVSPSMGTGSKTIAPEWPTDATGLANSLRAKNISDSVVARAHVAAQVGISIPVSFDKMGPVAKIRAMTAAKPSGESLARLLNTGAHRNTIRQVQDSLRSVAAGVQ